MTRPPAAATLLDRLAWRAAAEPRAEAFLFEGRSRSVGEMWKAAGGFAVRLTDLGVSRGARVVLALDNGPDFFTAFHGALRAGAIAVPVFPGSGAGRLASTARRSGAGLAIVGSAPLADAVRREAELQGARLRVDTATLDPRAATARPLPPIHPGAVAYIQYTSGSTGEPKGVQITHANLVANLEQMIAGMEITRRDVFVSWLPVHHDMGLVLMTMVPFYLGARLVLLPARLRDMRRWLGAIGEHRGTFTAAPDFAYRLCLRYAGDAARYDLSSLRVALDAAEPVRAGTLADFERTFGLANVMAPGYGLAEATVGVSMARPGSPAKIDTRGFPSVGRGFPGVELAILGRGGLRAAGEVGEILVRGPAVTPGYWRDRRATAALFRDDWLRTGDLGYLDEHGDLFVVGRRKNLIIQAGRNVAPREVEEAIDAFPFVRRSAAVGIDRGGRAGEQIYAFAELRAAKRRPEAEYRRMTIELTAAVRSHLGLGPGRVYLVPPRTIPLTHNGKTRHRELARRYLDGSLAAEGRLLFPGY